MSEISKLFLPLASFFIFEFENWEKVGLLERKKSDSTSQSTSKKKKTHAAYLADRKEEIYDLQGMVKQNSPVVSEFCSSKTTKSRSTHVERLKVVGFPSKGR